MSEPFTLATLAKTMGQIPPQTTPDYLIQIGNEFQAVTLTAELRAEAQAWLRLSASGWKYPLNSLLASHALIAEVQSTLAEFNRPTEAFGVPLSHTYMGYHLIGAFDPERAAFFNWLLCKLC